MTGTNKIPALASILLAGLVLVSSRIKMYKYLI